MNQIIIPSSSIFEGQSFDVQFNSDIQEGTSITYEITGVAQSRINIPINSEPFRIYNGSVVLTIPVNLNYSSSNVGDDAVLTISFYTNTSQLNPDGETTTIKVLLASADIIILDRTVLPPVVPPLSIVVPSSSIFEGQSFFIDVNTTPPVTQLVEIPYEITGINQNRYTISPANKITITQGSNLGRLTVSINTNTVNEDSNLMTIRLLPPYSATGDIYINNAASL
jgi:hypothetical protein